MEAVQFFGFAAIVTSIASGFPQALRLIRKRNAEGLALGTQVLNLLGIISWLAYGVMRVDAVQLIVNGLAAVPMAIIMFSLFKWADVRASSFILPTMAWAAVLLVSAILFGWMGVGLCASALSLLIFTPQAWLAIVSPGGEGLSVCTYVITTVSKFAWIGYALLSHDILVVGSSVWTAILTAIVIIRALIVTRNDTKVPTAPRTLSVIPKPALVTEAGAGSF